MEPLTLGSVIAGCRIDAVAGRGGMGTVYRAYQLALDRVVAVKIVNPELAADHEFRDRFRREARLAAALDHPNVVPVLHAGEEGGHVFLVMRFIDGTDLGQVLRGTGPLPVADVRAIAEQIGSALDAAHARGLVHRDVKPANILLTGRPGQLHCYLTDFGITKDNSERGLTQTGVALGTVDYMAPEQITGAALDGRADLYSLGCVLYQSLTGQVPYPGDTAPTRLVGHLQGAIPDPRRQRPDLDAATAAAVMHALAKDPAQRFPSGAQLSRALSGQEPVRIPTPDRRAVGSGSSAPGSSSRSGGSGPSRRTMMLGAGALVVAAGGAAAAVTQPWKSSATRSISTSTTSTATGIVTTGPAAGWVAGSPITVGDGPVDLVPSADALWTANGAGASVSQVDPSTGKVRTVSVGGRPAAIVFGQERAWCWNYSDSLTPVDPSSMTAGSLVRTETGAFGQIAAGTDLVWFTVPAQGAIGRVEMRSAQFVAGLIPLGGRPAGLAVDSGTVYVVLPATNKLVRVAESTGTVSEPVTLPNGIQSVSAENGRVWLLGSGQLLPLQGNTLGQPITIPGTAVLPTKDNVWVLDSVNNRILRYSADGRTQQGSPINGIGENVSDLEFSSGSLWALNQTSSSLTRIQPG